MTNGYIVLTKGDSKLYQHAVEAINLGKPVYFVDAENKAIYFGTKIALEDADVVIDAGKYTVTIEADNDVLVTTSLDLSIIEDSNGNKRFIEGSGTISTLPTGVTNVYNKWSLSGTHLMFVAIFDLATGAELIQDSITITYNDLPRWIIDKINVLWGAALVDQKAFTMNNPNTSGQDVIVQLRKENETTITIKQRSTATLNLDRSVRFQFDLLIDSD